MGILLIIIVHRDTSCVSRLTHVVCEKVAPQRLNDSTRRTNSLARAFVLPFSCIYRPISCEGLVPQLMLQLHLYKIILWTGLHSAAEQARGPCCATCHPNRAPQALPQAAQASRQVGIKTRGSWRNDAKQQSTSRELFTLPHREPSHDQIARAPQPFQRQKGAHHGPRKGAVLRA